VLSRHPWNTKKDLKVQKLIFKPVREINRNPKRNLASEEAALIASKVWLHKKREESITMESLSI
jgi:hypothetical protein